MSDLIRRSDAMGAVQDHFNADGFKGYDDGQKMMDRIKALPSAEPKTVEWISNRDGSWNCSECGLRVFVYAKGNYCPNCGAKMKGGEDE